MNRHVVAGLFGLVLAGCTLDRSQGKRVNPHMPPVGLTPPLPSIHEAINQENGRVDPESLRAGHPADAAATKSTEVAAADPAAESGPAAAAPSEADAGAEAATGVTSNDGAGREGRVRIPIRSRPDAALPADDPEATVTPALVAEVGTDRLAPSTELAPAIEPDPTAGAPTVPGTAASLGSAAGGSDPAAGPATDLAASSGVASPPDPDSSARPAAAPVPERDPLLGPNPDIMPAFDAAPALARRAARAPQPGVPAPGRAGSVDGLEPAAGEPPTTAPPPGGSAAAPADAPPVVELAPPTAVEPEAPAATATATPGPPSESPSAAPVGGGTGAGAVDRDPLLGPNPDLMPEFDLPAKAATGPARVRPAPAFAPSVPAAADTVGSEFAPAPAATPAPAAGPVVVPPTAEGPATSTAAPTAASPLERSAAPPAPAPPGGAGAADRDPLLGAEPDVMSNLPLLPTDPGRAALPPAAPSRLEAPTPAAAAAAPQGPPAVPEPSPAPVPISVPRETLVGPAPTAPVPAPAPAPVPPEGPPPPAVEPAPTVTASPSAPSPVAVPVPAPAPVPSRPATEALPSSPGAPRPAAGPPPPTTAAPIRDKSAKPAPAPAAVPSPSPSPSPAPKPVAPPEPSAEPVALPPLSAPGASVSDTGPSGSAFRVRRAVADPSRRPTIRTAVGRSGASVTVRKVADEPMSVRSKLPERSVIETGKPAAQVGEEVITVHDLRKAVTVRRRGMPAGPMSAADRYALARMVLNDMVDKSIVIQEAKREIKNKKQLEMFMQQADKVWADEELPPLLRETASANVYELKEKLAERGESVEDIRESFRKEFLFRGFLEHKVGPKLKVELPEMREYYAAHRRDFVLPAQVTWREVLVEVDRYPGRAAARRKADALVARLVRGDDFAAVARAESDGPNKSAGGLWQTTPGGYAVAEVNAALAALAVGQVSRVLEGPTSFHVVRVEGRRAAGPAPFSEVQSKIQRALRSEKIARESTTFLEKLRRQTVVTTVFDDPAVTRASAEVAVPARPRADRPR